MPVPMPFGRYKGATRPQAAPNGPSTTEIASAIRKREANTFFLLTAVALVGMMYFLSHAPAPSGEHCEGVSLKWVVENAREKAGVEKMMKCAQEYKRENQAFLIAGFCVTYITFQAFAIPGGMGLLLNILSGAVFPFFMAEVIVMFCATVGATCCFLLSNSLGRGIIGAYRLDPLLADFRAKVNDNRHRLFPFLVLTRCTPVPAVLINMASPILDVPFWPFVMSTIIGQIPLNTVHMFAGYTMAQTGSFQAGSIKWIMATGVVLTLFFLFGGKIKSKISHQAPKSD